MVQRFVLAINLDGLAHLHFQTQLFGSKSLPEVPSMLPDALARHDPN